MMVKTHYNKCGDSLCNRVNISKPPELTNDPLCVDCEVCIKILKYMKQKVIEEKKKKQLPERKCNAHGCNKKFIPQNRYFFNCGCLHNVVEYF